ncbi:MAG: DUF4010 domain-containing protein [Bacteroidota bacterium]|nr:DUF4010 domain-containing protein [Bacteroidota bacterium]
MENIQQYLGNSIPAGLSNFLLVLVFSLLIGLSQRRLNLHKEAALFGSDRTFTLIGLLGYLLYLFRPTDFALFAGGGLVLTILLSLNYYFKVSRMGDYGITSIVTALITYCMGPLVCLTSSWFFVSVVVVVLLLADMKTTFVELAEKMNNDEFIILAKFLLISFIILPMLPDKRIIPEISLTPYRIWLATVIVSAISYVSYLLRQYVFPQSGVLVSGIVGGLYSSTATISILSKKSKNAPAASMPDYLTAMYLAIGMMFLRLMIIIAIFNWSVFRYLFIPMSVLMLFTCSVGLFFYFRNKKKPVHPENEVAHEVDETHGTRENPLEFKVALIFAFLFVVFTLLTYYANEYMGSNGVTLLSAISGLGDITPFLLNLLSGQFTGVTINLMVSSCLLATLSNNVIKMTYAIGFSGGRKELRIPLLKGFGAIALVNLILFLLFL